MLLLLIISYYVELKCMYVEQRFQGSARGTVQYAGPLMDLLDMPSWYLVHEKKHPLCTFMFTYMPLIRM